MDEWVKMSEAAELEGIAYDALKMKIVRGNYITEAITDDINGGRDRVIVAVSSLSEPAQQKYRRRKRDAELRRRREELADEPPWYTCVTLDWYINNYKKKYHKACSLKTELEKYFAEVKQYKGEGTEYSKKFACEHLRVSDRQLRRYIKAYRDGAMWAELYSPEGNFEYFKVLALCPPPQIGKGLELTEDMQQLLVQLWSDGLYQKNNQAFTLLYDRFCDILKDKGETHIPSYNSCKLFINRRVEYGSGDVKTLIKYGAKGFKNSVMIKKSRDCAGVDVLELVQGDAHTFDCWVSYKRSDGKIVAIRPYLVGFIDTRSRCLVGWGICVCPNSEVIKQVVIHMIYPKAGSEIYGVPKVIYIDNGKDFTAETLTGRNRKERGSFELDADTKGFYAAAGIEEYKRALPYQPWSKGQIERFFGTLCGQFSKQFESYTGTLTGSKTSGKVQKNIEKMLNDGALDTIEEFSAKFEKWLSKYHNRAHKGLREQGESEPIPIKVWQNAPRYQKAAPPIEYVLSLLGKTEYRRVSNVGISVNNRLYTHSDLGRYIGEQVIVRYNRADDDCICVYNTQDGSLITKAYTYDRIDVNGDSEADEELMTHYKAQSHQLKNARDRLSIMRQAAPPVILPELSGERANVTAIPEDRQYRQEMLKQAMEQRTREKRQTTPDFVKKIGASVYEELERLG